VRGQRLYCAALRFYVVPRPVGFMRRRERFEHKGGVRGQRLYCAALRFYVVPRPVGFMRRRERFGKP
jgi:hypothetical protein